MRDGVPYGAAPTSAGYILPGDNNGEIKVVPEGATPYNVKVKGWDGKSDTDEKVKQTETSANANYEVLLSGTADNTTRTEGTNKSGNLIFNPDSGELTATKLTGNIKGNELSYSQIVNGLGYVPVNVNSPKVANVNDTIVKRDSNGGIFGNMNGLYNKFYAYNSVPSDATSYKALIENRPQVAMCMYAELSSNITLPIIAFPASGYVFFYCVAFDQLQGNISHFAFKAYNTGIVNIHNDATGLSALVGDYNPNKNEKLVSLKTEQNYSYFVWLWMV